MDLEDRLVRLREELIGLKQTRRHLLERLANLEENITFKERISDALAEEVARAGGAARTAQDARYGGIRAAIIERLAADPDGADAAAIGRMIVHRFGDAVHPKSHYAALKRLAQEGITVREGRRWKLAERTDP